MVKLWVLRIRLGWSTLDDVPERYREQVEVELNASEQSEQ